MKIHTTPVVKLIASQVLHNDDIAQFLDEHETQWVRDENGDGVDGFLLSAAENVTEFGGRLCYMSFANPRPGGNKAYLDNIKESGHGSVLEHAVFTFCITGVSRTLTHELVRHRAGTAFSQLSQRYVDESVAEYVEPDIIANDPLLHHLWVTAIHTAHEAYLALVDGLNEKLSKQWENTAKSLVPGKTELRKTARQAARSVLPNATETKILLTANARAVRHILEQRGSRHAEPEIRKLAYLIYQIVNVTAPNLFSDYAAVSLPDGTMELTTPYRKV